MNVTLPDGVELQAFEPCQIILPEAGITEYVFEDCAYVAVPVVPGVYHTVDWMLSLDGKRLVGIQFWDIHPALKPSDERAAIAGPIKFSGPAVERDAMVKDDD